MVLKKHNQNGFGLAIALLIVGFVTTIITSFVLSQSGQVIKKEAEIAGWEGAKIARAARIFVRDHIAGEGAFSVSRGGFLPDGRLNLATSLSQAGGGPVEFTIQDLADVSLLPQGFARQNSGNYLNALGQNIRIYMANHPIDGDPNDGATVPTAYVIFEDNDISTPSIVQDIVQSIRAQDVSVSAPIPNVTDTCDNGDTTSATTALWDSGCLNLEDYALLTGSVFQQGTFVIPTWRSVSFDTRAVMRFPQPEQSGVQTMLTNLEMADVNNCDRDIDTPDTSLGFVSIFTNDGEQATEISGFCSDQLNVDTGDPINNRRSIDNVGNINETLQMIVDPQSVLDIDEDATGALTVLDPLVNSEGNTLSVGGLMQAISGDLLIYGDSVSVTNALTVDKNITVVSDNPSVGLGNGASVNIGGVLNSQRADTDNLTVNGAANFASDIAVLGAATNVENFIVSDTLSSRLLNRSDGGPAPVPVIVGQQMTVSNKIELENLIISGNSEVQGQVGNNYSFISGSLQGDTLNIGGSVTMVGNSVANFEDSLDVLGTIDIENDFNSDGDLVEAFCVGDCPRRIANNLCSTFAYPSDVYQNIGECLDALD